MPKTRRLANVFNVSNPVSQDSVGARIRLMRQHRGMTQEELAEAVGVSRSAVALWETDRGGEADHLPRLSEILAVPVEFFVTGMARHNVVETLSIDESALIALYRVCSIPDQLRLLRLASQLTERARKQTP